MTAWERGSVVQSPAFLCIEGVDSVTFSAASSAAPGVHARSEGHRFNLASALSLIRRKPLVPWLDRRERAEIGALETGQKGVEVSMDRRFKIPSVPSISDYPRSDLETASLSNQGRPKGDKVELSFLPAGGKPPLPTP